MPKQVLSEVGRVFDEGRDLTVGIEEEFQILHGDSLELTSRYEDLKAAGDEAFGRPLVFSELLRSEAEINSRKCESFPEAKTDIMVKRKAIVQAAHSLGLKLGATGVHPFSLWEHQSYVDTDHYRKVVERLQYIAWTNNTFGLHLHCGVRGAQRAIAVHDAYRSLLPPLLALSASSPFYRGRRTNLHSTRAQIFIRSFPRCGIPDAYRDWENYAEYSQLLYDTGSVTEPTQLWWTLRPHETYGTVEVRIADGQPRLADSMALVALMLGLVADLLHQHDQGRPLIVHSGRLLEENRWRAERYGLEGKLIDFERRIEEPAAEVIKRLLERASRAAPDLGLEADLAHVEEILREGNCAQRQLAMFEGGMDIPAIHEAMTAEVMSALDAPAQE